MNLKQKEANVLKAKTKSIKVFTESHPYNLKKRTPKILQDDEVYSTKPVKEIPTRWAKVFETSKSLFYSVWLEIYKLKEMIEEK